MKKTMTINLNGSVFNIDEDAYQTLKEYLSELEQHFTSGEDAEILKDIEARIAELFAEGLKNGRNVVVLTDVEAVISKLGHVNDFEEEEKTTNKKKCRMRHFYRDPENTILGGVASGVAAYLGWDITLVRILFLVLLVVGFGYVIPLYLIVWLIAPVAETPAQRLEMFGEEVTVDNLKNSLNSAKNYLESDSFKKSANGVGNKLIEILRFFIKFIFIVIACVFVLVGVLLLMALLIAGIVYLAEPTLLFPNSNVFVLFASIALIIVLPLIGLISLVVRLARKKHIDKPRRHWVGLTLFIVWVLALLLLIYSAIRLSGLNENKAGIVVSEPRSITAFHTINASNGLNIELHQDSIYALRVRGDANNLPQFSAEVIDSVLFLYSNLVGSYDLEINTPDLEKIILANGCRLNCLDTFYTTNIDIELANAACMKMLVCVNNKLDVQMANASKLDLCGRTDELNITASSAAKIDADELNARIGRLDLGNLVKAEVWVTDTLKANVQNATKIEYKGNPYMKNQVANLSVVEHID